LSREVATTEKVVGSERALQARKRNAPRIKASQSCQRIPSLGEWYVRHLLVEKNVLVTDTHREGYGKVRADNLRVTLPLFSQPISQPFESSFFEEP
jgi:hypothetical protein